MGSKERKELLSQGSASLAQRTSDIISRYVMYGYTRTPVTRKSVESDVLDGFEILPKTLKLSHKVSNLISSFKKEKGNIATVMFFSGRKALRMTDKSFILIVAFQKRKQK